MYSSSKYDTFGSEHEIAYRHNGIIEWMLQYQTRITSPIDARICIA